MPNNKDILEWVELLDNEYSYIHQPAFKQLKRSLIRQITAAYEVDHMNAVTAEQGNR